mgnify:CR=1 FL=1
MKCPACGNHEFFIGAKDVAYAYKGHNTIFHAVKGKHCLSCDEVIMSMDEADAFLALTAKFESEVDGAAGGAAAASAQESEPAYIAKVRAKLALSQREANEIFGGGPNGFSRYENGKAQAPRSTVKLLRVLDSHPELLDEIRY